MSAVRTLSHGGSRSAALPVQYRVRTVLAVAQIALSVVLLVGAGLLARIFVAVLRVDPGFRSDRHLTFRVAIPESRYKSPDGIAAALSELQQRVQSLPAVTSVGAISHLPFDDLPNWGLTYALKGPKPPGGAPLANTRAITPGLLEAGGTQLVAGRFFTEHDRAPVAIVDDLLAARLWPGRSAVGQHLMIGQGEPNREVAIVGVVRHLNLRSVVDDLIPQIYLPYRVWPRSPMAFVVRTNGVSAELAADVRRAVTAFDPQLPIFDVRGLDAYVQSAHAIRRFTVWLAVAFAGSALVLTCIGMYGVLAYAVTARRHEFGVRRALGADASDVIRDVLSEGVRYSCVGCLGGSAAALIAAQLLESQLYAVEPRDPITYVMAAAIILTGAMVACSIPAYRATNVSPMDALRTE
jgi:putative ABC transport system permease protein